MRVYILSKDSLGIGKDSLGIVALGIVYDVTHCYNLGCVRLGNPDLDFQNLNPDFPIERTRREKVRSSILMRVFPHTNTCLPPY